MALILEAAGTAELASLGQVRSLPGQGGDRLLIQWQGKSERQIVQIAQSLVSVFTKAHLAVPSVDSSRWPQGGLIFSCDGVTVEITLKPGVHDNETALDRAKRLRAETLKEANRVFADRRRASSWLRRKNRVFGGQAPLAMLDTEEGVRAVSEELGRIDYGMLS